MIELRARTPCHAWGREAVVLRRPRVAEYGTLFTRCYRVHTLSVSRRVTLSVSAVSEQNLDIAFIT